MRTSILSRRATAKPLPPQPDVADVATASLASAGGIPAGAAAELRARLADIAAIDRQLVELDEREARVQAQGSARLPASPDRAGPLRRLATLLSGGTPDAAEVQALERQVADADASARATEPVREAMAVALGEIVSERARLQAERIALARELPPLQQAALVAVARRRAADSWQNATAALDALGGAIAQWVAYERIAMDTANQGRESYIGGAPYTRVWTNDGAIELHGLGQWHAVDVEARVRELRTAWQSEAARIARGEG